MKEDFKVWADEKLDDEINDLEAKLKLRRDWKVQLSTGVTVAVNNGEHTHTVTKIATPDLSGMKLRDAIRAIAVANDNEFKPMYARPVLVKAGILKGTRSAGNYLNRVLNEMVDMVHIRRNLWRWAPAISLNPADAESAAPDEEGEDTLENLLAELGDGYASRVRPPEPELPDGPPSPTLGRERW